MNVCAKCGATVGSGLSFCSHCGQPVPRVNHAYLATFECPGCHTVFTGQPRFCERCGRPFNVPAVQLRASTAPNANPARVLLVLLAIFGGAFGLLILVALGSHQSQRASGAMASQETSPPSIARTTDEGDTARATKPASRPPIAATAHDGDIVPAAQSLFCGSSKDALDEITKWAVLHDTKECVRVVIRTHSSVLKQGDMVKVLDRGFFTTKIRILETDSECWVPSEAIR